MPITFTLERDVPEGVQVLGVPVFAGEHAGPGAVFDAAFLAERGFEGKLEETLAVPGEDGTTIIAVGMGERASLDEEGLRRAAAALVKAAWRDEVVATTLPQAVTGTPISPERAAQVVAEGAVMGAYRFVRYKSDPKPCAIRSVVVVGAGGSRVRSALARGAAIAEAVNLARDLANTPAADLTPARLAEVAVEVGTRAGLAVEVWDEARIAAERLGGLMAVARGSVEPPRLVRLTYEPPGRPRGTVALVGKGITFDSGGLSLKPAEGMEQMKTDMSGAAAVIAAMSVLTAVGARTRVVGIVPVTENMPDGRAYKPGDVLRFRNDKTAEVLNTDAEGRLILADALALAVEAGADAIVDVATLTGACIVALGPKIAGLFASHDDWAAQIADAAARAGERVWRLPLPPDYRRMIDSDVADMKNTGGRHGGAITAALFLREFVGEVPWVHLDIAGPARLDTDDGYVPKGATGAGVRTLVEAVAGFRRPRASG